MKETAVSIEPSQLTAIFIDEKITVKHTSQDIRMNIVHDDNVHQGSAGGVKLEIRSVNRDIEVLIKLNPAEVNAVAQGLVSVLSNEGDER